MVLSMQERCVPQFVRRKRTDHYSGAWHLRLVHKGIIPLEHDEIESLPPIGLAVNFYCYHGTEKVNMMTMDTRVKTYKTAADFNKDQKLMARIGWAVTNTATFQRKLTVTYQREVTAEHPATSAHAGAFAEHLQEQTERMNMRVANEKTLRKTGGSWLQRLEALMKPN